MKMKKFACLFCIAAFCVTLLSGCGNKTYKQLSFFLEPGSYKNSSISLKCKVPETENGYSFRYEFSQSGTDEDAGFFEDVTIFSDSEDAYVITNVFVFDISFSNSNHTKTHRWLYDLNGVPLSIPDDITATTFVEQVLPTCFLSENTDIAADFINSDKVKEHYSWDYLYDSTFEIYKYPYPCYMSTEVWQTNLAGKTYSCKEISSHRPWSVQSNGCSTILGQQYNLQRAYARRQGDYMIYILSSASCSSVEKGREAIDVVMSYFSKA